MTTLPEAEAPVIQVIDVAQDIAALDLEGEFDIAAAPAILEEAERALDGGKHLIVNLSDATFIDSSTVHALFKADEAAKEVDRKLVLQFGTHAAVERVLAITGAERILEVAKSREAAIALIDGRSDPGRPF